MSRPDGQQTLRKGDRFRFTQDYFVHGKREPGYPLGRDILVAEAGVEGRVIWAGRSYDNPQIGTWRVGVMLPGRSKPRFINQRYMEKI